MAWFTASWEGPGLPTRMGQKLQSSLGWQTGHWQECAEEHQQMTGGHPADKAGTGRWAISLREEALVLGSGGTGGT